MAFKMRQVKRNQYIVYLFLKISKEPKRDKCLTITQQRNQEANLLNLPWDPYDTWRNL